MKKLIFGCVIAVCGFLMPQVSANDYCCSPQFDPCCCEEEGFDGLYLGGNVGVFTHTAHRNGLTTTDFSVNNTNVTAGVQLGYDWQCNSSLFGLVVDWNWVNTDRRANGLADSFVENSFDWFTTIRARAGLTVCDALVYVTGGAVVSRFESRWNTGVLDFRFHDTRWGWTGGVGAEFKVWCNWSLGAEILLLQFSHHTNRDGALVFGHSDSSWVGRILLNYRFGDLCSWCW